MSWVLTLLGIVALIVLHELGHFAVAKAVGMRVERFSLFFPPTLFKLRRGETEYAIGAIPRGRLREDHRHDPGGAQRRSTCAWPFARYYMQAPWKRIVVILAGPGVNLLIAFVLFWAMLVTGNLNGAGALESLDPAVATLALDTGRGSRARPARRRGAAARGPHHRRRRAARDVRVGRCGPIARIAARERSSKAVARPRRCA